MTDPLVLSPVRGLPKLCNQSSSLLEEFQIFDTEEIPSKLYVPNHLLDTKIYSTLKQNKYVEARPAVVHISGYNINEAKFAKVTLVNTSRDVLRIHIIPPQTRYFKISYKKQQRMVPGLSLTCHIEFIADEWRYYQDFVRIHCQNDEDLVVPLHAYPVMNTDAFPSVIKFPPVPVGHEKTKSIPLRSHIPVQFEYRLVLLRNHPAFRVEPIHGIVPANGESKVRITFAPTDFTTASMQLQLIVSQFDNKTLTCTITGSSHPNLLKEKATEHFSTEGLQESTKARVQEMTRTHQKLLREISWPKKSKTSDKARNAKQKEDTQITSDGILIDEDLRTHYSVTKILNQEPGKLKLKELRKIGTSSQATNRQMKETKFIQQVRANVQEEHENQLRWQIRIGADELKDEDINKILSERKIHYAQYAARRGELLPSEECDRHENQVYFRRTMRPVRTQDESNFTPKFDPSDNEPWSTRYTLLQKFIQAARKVIIRNRAEKNVRLLRENLIGWGEAHLAQQDLSAASARTHTGLCNESIKAENVVDVSDIQIGHLTFPHYVASENSKEVLPGAIGHLANEPMELNFDTEIPYHELSVPIQSAILDYKRYDMAEAATCYIPTGLARPLRVGAEDELLGLPAVSVATTKDQDKKATKQSPSSQETTLVQFDPPKGIEIPSQFHPLHIFNPAPGVQTFLPTYGYSEVDTDHNLCPMPRFPKANQRKFLDKNDVISGIMSWRKFPSTTLSSLSTSKTLSALWLPKWSERLSNNFLPGLSPDLLEGPCQCGDKQYEVSGKILTPEMVTAEFNVLDDSEEKTSSSANMKVISSTRELKERELEASIAKTYGEYSDRIKTRINQINDSLNKKETS